MALTLSLTNHMRMSTSAAARNGPFLKHARHILGSMDQPNSRTKTCGVGSSDMVTATGPLKVIPDQIHIGVTPTQVYP